MSQLDKSVAVLAFADFSEDQDREWFADGLAEEIMNALESALDSLENGLAIGDPLATHMNYVKVYDPIRNDPRFQAMLSKMNLLDGTNTR
jgi:hypothetical protein